MKKTRFGTLTANSYEESTGIGMGIGLWNDQTKRTEPCACLENHKDMGLVLLVNDEKLKELGIPVVHTDNDWDPLESEE